ncbi:uncharacterized protein LOC124274576 [Haliotis rubra]|uniref:uncharacterized protein LOC124274576 n=1 Tax=Haliotis rubra TaxID=36100 RepID=UPI001EE54E64|nr:uncharacterized protein LOC124274576 [Haliotis rubra]
MVNMTSVEEGFENVCFAQLRPCLDNIRPLHSIDGFQGLVVDGRLAVPCQSNIREENWNCIASVSQCKDNGLYRDIRYSQLSWDFLCQSSPAFVAGKDCWKSSELEPTLIKCFGPSSNVCEPTCLQERAAKIPGCSTEDATLLRRLARISMEGRHATC